jgi:hypothetical protein
VAGSGGIRAVMPVDSGFSYSYHSRRSTELRHLEIRKKVIPR